MNDFLLHDTVEKHTVSVDADQLDLYKCIGIDAESDRVDRGFQCENAARKSERFDAMR